MMRMFPDGTPLYMIMAATAGGVVAALFDLRDWKRAARKLIIGTLTAWYLTPVTLHLIGPLKIQEGHDLSVAGFLTGILGLLIIETIYAVFKEHVADWRSKLFGGGANAKDR